MKTESESGYYIPRMTAAIDMLSIAFLWCVSLIVTNPFGNFPLNDDWSYGLAVKHLIENGDFRPTGWTSMPLITQALWGALFSVPAGFSFSALRLSTLTLSLLGVFATYLLMREVHQPRWLAALASLTLAFSPIYYALSHTFMTDVPYTAITIIASVFFVRNLKSGSYLAFLFGTILSIAATLSRQLAISVPLAFAVAFILKNGITNRNILRAAIPPFFCIGALLVFQQWLAATGRLPEFYFAKNVNFFRAFTKPGTILAVIESAYVALVYLGLFLLPVLIFVFGGFFGSNKKKTIALLIFLTSVIVISGYGTLCGNHSFLMPSSGNIIIQSGIGPLTLHDTAILKLNNMAALPISFWLVVTVISLLGAALLITAMGLNVINLAPKFWPAKMDGNEAASAFLVLSAMIYLFPLLVGDFADRYLVPTIPFIAAGIASVFSHIPRTVTRVCRFTAAVLIFACSLFAICGTRDYLAWNRIRWEALHDLMKSKHAKVEEIDGGFEFNGWYFYDPQFKRVPRKGSKKGLKKSWWWVKEDTYRIGFGSMPDYTVIKEYNYLQWLPPHSGKIVVLKYIENPQETSSISGGEHAEQNAPADADKPRR